MKADSANTPSRVSERETRIDQLEKDLENLRVSVGELTAARENAVTDLNKASAESAGHLKLANAETESRKKIQQELINLRTDHTALIRREGETTEKLNTESKLRLEQESLLADLKTEVSKLTEALQAKDQLIESVSRDNKRIHRTLKENHIVEVDAQGNIQL